MQDKHGHDCFDIQQRYMLPVNEADGEGSVTFVVITCEAEFSKKRFYYSFRKWLQSMGIPVVQYCVAAGIMEVLACGDYPEVK